MTEHHTKQDSNAYILPVSIILAALIVSGSVLFAMSNIATQLNKTGIINGTGGVAAQAQAPTAPNPTPTQAAPAPQPAGTVKMADAMKDAQATKGDPNAKIVVIEFSDFQCPFCRRYFEDANPQVQSQYVDTKKVLFVYKDFPLTSIHPGAQPYAEAARCAGEQSKFWEYHDKIFTEQAKQGQGTVQFVGNDALKQWATDIGLDAAKFNSCFDAGKYRSVVQSNENDGIQVGVSGTPSFYIGKKDGTGTLLVGAQPFSAFKAAIDALN